MTEQQLLEGSVLLVNKPYMWTSFQVVKKIKNTIKSEYGISKIKIGHAGTLDPLATGLLIICTGKFTKRIEEFQTQEKEYTGSFTLGATTPSFDMEHPIDQIFPVDQITEQQIYSVAASFIGEQEQTPPIYSAIKIDGRRAFAYARNKEEVIIKPKIISIKEFEILQIDFPNVNFRVVCSKGTYIRSLARDFGIALDSGAYLSSLVRKRIGNFQLEDAIELSDLISFFNASTI